MIKSYLPTEIPPDEIKQSKSLSASYFFKISISLSLTYFISVTSPPNIFIKFFNVCVFDELIVPFGFCMFFISSPVIKIANLGFVKTLIFFRLSDDPPHNLYHHIGIYAFTNKALEKYVNLKRSKLELDRKLEQLRALENNMSIHVGFVKTFPLSVDTEQDLNEVRKLLEKK